jgi:hypothetical protein
MMYYREQKEQEQEKAKREQAIAEFQSHLADQKHEESEKKREESEMCKYFTFFLVPEFFFLFFFLLFLKVDLLRRVSSFRVHTLWYQNFIFFFCLSHVCLRHCL